MDMTQYAGSESNFLKASDIQGSTPTVTIERVEEVSFEKDGKTDIKPAIHFVGKEKGVVLNKTNTRSLIEAFGALSDDWLNKQAMLSVVTTEMGPGIRVTPLQGEADAQPSW